MNENIFNVEFGEIIEPKGQFVPSDVLKLQVKTQFGIVNNSLENTITSIQSLMDTAPDNTYCIVAKQKNTNSNRILANCLKQLDSVDYSYLQNTDKIVFSICKQNDVIKENFIK